MIIEKWFTEKRFHLFSLLLFLFLFGYILLRAWFVDLLHDEAATFLHYIETGYIWSDKANLDANNHLLNSFAGRILFKLFGENYFLLRLPNVLSFPIYFWALYQLSGFQKKPIIRFIILLGTTCIPFILEYFGNCRGYGISMAFFFASLVFLSRLAKKITLSQHLLLILCLLIATYANLTFLVSTVLASAFVLIQQFLQRQNVTFKNQVFHFFLHLLFVVALLPAFYFAQKLKIGGALYYGRLDGLWEVTGRTLSSYTLFTDHYVLKWIFIFLGVTIIILLLRRWIQLGIRTFFQEENTLFGWFFFGHIAVIFVLATFMKVNYPEDRVGMYLIILALLLLTSMMNRLRLSAWFYLPLLFFPISFVPKINLSTSVFSPDDRMTKRFYQEVIKALDDDKTSLSNYNLMCLTWALHDRQSEYARIPANFDNVSHHADVVLSRRNLEQVPGFWSDFDTVFADPSNGFLIFKRKQIPKKIVVFDTLLSVPQSMNQFIGLYTLKIADSLRGKKMQIHMKGTILAEYPREELTLTYSLFDTKGQSILYDGWTTRWSIGLKKEQKFLFNYPIEGWKKNDGEVRIYLYNKFNSPVEVKNIRLELLRLE